MNRTTQGWYKTQTVWTTAVLLESTEGGGIAGKLNCARKGEVGERCLTGYTKVRSIEDKDSWNHLYDALLRCLQELFLLFTSFTVGKFQVLHFSIDLVYRPLGSPSNLTSANSKLKPTGGPLC